MYEFENTGIKDHEDEWQLPSSAMLYDGIYLEKEIEGYRTLSVTGREMLSLDFTIEETGSRTIKMKQKLPSRTLKITYQLIGKDAQDVQKKYHRLMRSLYREQPVEIRFKDEKEYSYFGQYQASEEVSGNKNQLISSFELFCPDPKKYSVLFQSTGPILAHLPYQVLPEKIQVITKNQDILKITNQDKVIKITGRQFSAGDQIIFDFQKGKVFVNGQDQTLLLDLDSDFENFYLHEGDQVFCSNGEMTIYFREVLL